MRILTKVVKQKTFYFILKSLFKLKKTTSAIVVKKKTHEKNVKQKQKKVKTLFSRRWGHIMISLNWLKV